MLITQFIENNKFYKENFKWLSTMSISQKYFCEDYVGDVYVSERATSCNSIALR